MEDGVGNKGHSVPGDSRGAFSLWTCKLVYLSVSLAATGKKSGLLTWSARM